MELRKLCAYNQTRECFLGLEVAATNRASAELKEQLGKLALKSGEGLWMTPFKGMPEVNLRAPLDLIYMDEDFRVTEIVEAFPTFHPLSQRAASVLALPAHSIYSSQTQAGDQIVLCVAEEMQSRLEGLSTSTGSVAGGVQSAVLLRGKPLWSGGPGVVELEDRSGADSSGEGIPKKPRPYEMDLAVPGMKVVKPQKSWLQRLWSPDPRKAPEHRKAPRETPHGLAAYYWTGAAPKSHVIRDISSSGLYVVTEERWYPGTLILMTLQAKASGDATAVQSLAVHSRAVRWGNDGVGLQFIPQDTPAARMGLNPLVSGADQKELNQFLERLRKGAG